MHKSALRTFGLALMAALGLMAFSAVAAQAEDLTDGGKAGYFLVLESKELVKGTEFTGAQVGSSKLLIPDFAPIYIKCEAADVNEGKFLNESEMLIKLTFLNCDSFELNAKGEETAMLSCKVTGNPGGELTIIATAIILAKLHDEELFLLFQPEKNAEGKALNFTTLKFSSECAFGATINIKGTFVALVHEGSADQRVHRLLFSEPIQLLLGDHLKFGAHELYFDATADIELSGAHDGCTWAVH